MNRFDKILVTISWIILLSATIVGNINIILFGGFTMIMLFLIGFDKKD